MATVSRPTTPQQANVLGSWKEIAAYLRKGVRTVQRWEQQLGLPVHRPEVAAKGMVFASPEELDQWLSMHWARRSDATESRKSSREFDIDATVHASQELRLANQVLLNDLMRNAAVLKTECEALALASARWSQKAGR